MIFGIVLALLFLAIVFFHYLQGFFSSALSAIIAIFAAVEAFSWHEVVVEKLLQATASNVSESLVLVFLFAIIYLILRVIFDKIIPGGVLLPAFVDRVGGAVMGAVAGVFALGILAVATQELPLSPSIAGYTKYATTDKNAQVMGTTGGRSQQQEATNFDELGSDQAGRFDEADRKNLFPWVVCGVDDVIINTVTRLSSGGSLAGDQPLTQVHPDFLQEMFAQRLGIQPGAQHSTFSPEKTPTIAVMDVFTVPQVRLSDPELTSVRQVMPKIIPPLVKIREIEHVERSSRDNSIIKTMKLQIAGPGTDPVNHDKQILLVVRVGFRKPAADIEDSNIRFSPGAFRLVTKQLDDSGNLRQCNIYPLGTVNSFPDGPVLYVDKPDDFLVIPLHPKAEGMPAADILYAVDTKGFMAGEKIDSGAFLEFKRLSRVNLGGKELKPWVKDAPGLAMGVLIKNPAVELGPGDESYVAPVAVKPAPAGTAVAPTTVRPASAAPSAVTPGVPSPLPAIAPGPVVTFPGDSAGNLMNVVLVAQTPELPVKISIPSADKNKSLISIPRVLESTVKNGQFQELVVNPEASLAELAGKGDFAVDQFFVPKGKVAWQIIGDSPPATYVWLRQSTNISLIDSTGATVKPSGCWDVINNGATNNLYARYNADYPLDLDSINPIPATGQEIRIGVIFLLPTGATPAQFKIISDVRDIRSVRVVTTLK